jgi:hypothetical protein
MNSDKTMKTFGLTFDQARVLRLLFDAALDSRPAPRWLHEAENQSVVARLTELNLLSDNGRLTMVGLAVAANLPKARHGSLSLAA